MSGDGASYDDVLSQPLDAPHWEPRWRWRDLFDCWRGAATTLLSQMRYGQLTLAFPDGAVRHFVGGDDPHAGGATLEVLRPRAFRRLLLSGAMGAAEAYIDGDWRSPDLTAALTLAARNQLLQGARIEGCRPAALLHRLRHLLRPNSRRGSRRNIAEHYDLGDDFFAAWLDPSMTYSSAWFERPDQDLAAAQEAKYRRLADALALRPEHHVLEIGCGWGGFAEFAARRYGCRVTGLTVSQAQFHYARRRIAAAGLSDRVEIRLEDYRDVAGVYDRIASIEMFEAVGERYWPVYFDVLRARLAPGGVAALQVITIDAERFEDYRRRADFIQRYIFPGGLLPSPQRLAAEITAAGLRLSDSVFFGASYARTLRLWAERFEAAWPQLAGAGGVDERFRRMWRYYLAYCEAGFATQMIDVGHFRIERP